MAGLGCRCEQDTTSAQLAQSVNTSPSFVRRVLAKLSKAGLVRTATGQAGACWLGRTPSEITLLDIYRAVDAPKAFAIHGYEPEKHCQVSCRIKEALEGVLGKTQKSLEATLKRVTLSEVLQDIKSE